MSFDREMDFAQRSPGERAAALVETLDRLRAVEDEPRLRAAQHLTAQLADLVAWLEASFRDSPLRDGTRETGLALSALREARVALAAANAALKTASADTD